MIRQIYLHGDLQSKFGSEPIALDVDSPALLVSGLSCVLKGFRNEFSRNTHYQFLKVDRIKKRVVPITGETWRLGLGNTEEIHITPSSEGSGLELAGMMGLTGFAYYAVGIMINIGLSMAMSAIANKLSGSVDTSSGDTSAAERNSFIFNQVNNIVDAGGPVQLVYGECLVGSTVISVGVVTENT